MSIPRPEHPRPGFCRANWQNLNGEWEFFNDVTGAGFDRELFKAEKFDGKITVPFCPESKLSGVGNTDFMPSVWYARNIKVDAKMLAGRVLLHFGACDYETAVYVNGSVAGTHVGGYTPFTFDITEFLSVGDNRLVVHAMDETRTAPLPRGKQSNLYYSHHCDYTRTTGIWQTVWLEFVPVTYLKKIKITATDLDGAVQLETTLNQYLRDAELRVEAMIDGKPAAKEIFSVSGVVSTQSFSVKPVKLWNVGEPNLYDVRFTLVVDGKDVDTVESYFGIRRVDIDGYKVRINGKSVYQRLVLDQGFYPDGIYTAPTDAALKRDIELSMAVGFNGARLHQKVFEERFLYHADKLGYIVWGEYASWGVQISDPQTLHEFLPQWLESVERDFNRPCVIGWCPYNETWDDNRKSSSRRQQLNTNISLMYEATKAADSTRIVIDTSGNYHTGKTDVYDVHDYNQSPVVYADQWAKHAAGEFYNNHTDRQTYDGKMPYWVSEFGGIKWNGTVGEKNDSKQSWGYGDAPTSVTEFADRFCGLVKPLLDASNIFGFCYTQLTDVEQEQNGVYNYDRTPKFSPDVYAKMRAAVAATAAIEKE